MRKTWVNIWYLILFTVVVFLLFFLNDLLNVSFAARCKENQNQACTGTGFFFSDDVKPFQTCYLLTLCCTQISL